MELNETIASKFGAGYASIGSRDIPDPVFEKAKRVMADFFAVLAVGLKIGPIVPPVKKYFLQMGGTEEATLPGNLPKIPAINAAFCIGAASHSVELDDGYRFGTCHPAVAVIPAALAVGERNDCSFEEIAAAVIKGYDIMLRLARAINPSHMNRGFHTTGTAGTIGAAVACAHLMGFDGEQTTYSLSLAGLQSAGLQEMLHDFPSIKPVQAGRAAAAGVLSVDLVHLNAKAPRTLFEGQHGWFKAMTDELQMDFLLQDLGKEWGITQTYTKLYPTCRHCHPSIDLAIDFHRAKIDPRAIKKIVVRTYQVALDEVAEIVCPQNEEEAMFSLPFSVALALSYGHVGVEHLEAETRNDQELIRLARQVTTVLDADVDRVYPQERGAIMEIELQDNRILKGQVRLPRGEPETALDDQELLNKMQKITHFYYGDQFASNLWQALVKQDLSRIDYQNILAMYGG